MQPPPGAKLPPNPGQSVSQSVAYSPGAVSQLVSQSVTNLATKGLNYHLTQVSQSVSQSVTLSPGAVSQSVSHIVTGCRQSVSQSHIHRVQPV